MAALIISLLDDIPVDLTDASLQTEALSGAN